MTDILERLRSDLHAEMEDERPSEVIDKYKQELRKAADEIGNPVTIEKIPLTVILRMDQRIGRGHTHTKTIARRRDRLHSSVGMGHGGKVGLAEVFARAPAAVEREISGSRAIAAGRGAADVLRGNRKARHSTSRLRLANYVAPDAARPTSALVQR